MNNTCAICKSEDSESQLGPNNIYVVNCRRCGKFLIDFISFNDSDTLTNTQSAILSYFIRNNQSSKLILSSAKIENILKTITLPAPSIQINNLLIYIGHQVTSPSETKKVNVLEITSILGSVNDEDVKYHLEHLKSEGFIYIESPILDGPLYQGDFDNAFCQLTHKGWERYDELTRTAKVSNLAFMAMKFGNEDLVNIFNKEIKDAVKNIGFEIRRLDEEKRAGLIDDKLRVEIRRSKFLIADLTDDNNGAYWEAGYAEGLGIPVIYICEKGKFKNKKTHFDTNHHLTVIWDKENLPAFEDELKATIRATFPNDAKMDD